MTEERARAQPLSTPSDDARSSPRPGCHTVDTFDGRSRLMATQRFLTLDDVAEILNVSWSQAYALVRRKELIAIQIGGRGQWRVEKDELERFIQQKYAEARAGVVEAPAEDTEVDTPR
jgi:excisionase family DNA binding protein